MAIDTADILSGLSTDWSSSNPVLEPGTLAIESDTGKMKVGNGSKWNDSSYTSAASAASYLGYNTPGASFDNMVLQRVYLKKVTLPAARTIVGIGASLKNAGSDQVGDFSVGVLLDNAGNPGLVRAYSSYRVQSLLLPTANGQRWVDSPIAFNNDTGANLDVWLGVFAESDLKLALAYDGSGTDKYYTAGGGWIADGGFTANTTTTNKYSIRALVV